MALIPCDECGKEISEKAAACPNCGAPVSGKSSVSLDPKSHAKVTRTGAKWEGIGFILILVGMFMAFFTHQEKSLAVGSIVAGFIIFIIGRFK
jgi:uncharacterized membrane protein YvbJ